MKILFALLVLGVVVIAAIIVMIKRSAGKAKPETDTAIKPLKPKIVAPKMEAPKSEVTAAPAPRPVPVEPVSKPVVAEVISEVQPERAPVIAEKVDAPSKIQVLGSVSYTPAASKPDTIPEDSVLKRHFLSARQAEKLAISNPYPTDSSLRRHYESHLKNLLLPESSVVQETAATEPSAHKIWIPEDSTLRRHYLTQLQAGLSSGS